MNIVMPLFSKSSVSKLFSVHCIKTQSGRFQIRPVYKEHFPKTSEFPDRFVWMAGLTIEIGPCISISWRSVDGAKVSQKIFLLTYYHTKSCH